MTYIGLFSRPGGYAINISFSPSIYSRSYDVFKKKSTILTGSQGYNMRGGLKFPIIFVTVMVRCHRNAIAIYIMEKNEPAKHTTLEG